MFIAFWSARGGPAATSNMFIIRDSLIILSILFFKHFHDYNTYTYTLAETTQHIHYVFTYETYKAMVSRHRAILYVLIALPLSLLLPLVLYILLSFLLLLLLLWLLLYISSCRDSGHYHIVISIVVSS